jgi:hypothetical protein
MNKEKLGEELNEKSEEEVKQGKAQVVRQNL